MDLYQILTQLCSLNGPSGFIGNIVDSAAKLLEPLVDEVSIDRMKSIIGIRRCGKPDAPKVLLDAHLDEIGFIVTGHEDGFLKFAAIGGIDPRMLPGRELTILGKKEGLGIIAVKPPHVLSAEERERSIPIKGLYIDVGLSQDEAQQRYPIGTPAVYRHEPVHLLGSRVSAKATDDRACFAVLLRTLDLIKGDNLDVDVYVLGSDAEEIGGTGAMTAAYRINPDCAIAVDVTFGMQPDVDSKDAFALGTGPTIGVGPNMARWMTKRMKSLAAKNKIPYSLEVLAGSSGTNGWEIQIAREGIATQVISLPQRYMHTPIEVVDLEDMEYTASLIAAFVRSLNKEVLGC